MSERPSFYITTAIHYPNGAPHIGHAYETFGADALARFKRLDGFDVFFLTGVDEHGLKMMQTAAKEGISPAELGERNTALFREMTDRFNCQYTDYIRTTEPRHKRSCQEIWRRMAEADDIYSDTYTGWYSVRDEAYYAESETTLNGDGVRVGPQGTPVEWTEEETYFFKLSKYQDRLLDYYDANPDFIAPESRRNEVISFVKGGLLDLSISRTTFDWGIPVPDVEGHIMYVWVDALTNYITGVGFPDTESRDYQTYWPADVHIIGKDILRFHAVYWPAFLLSAGLAPPKRVYAHGMIFNRGEKLSKSTGNVIDTASFADNYGVDQLRYFFLREVPFGQDGNYSHEAIVNRINADLANDFGNLAQRSLSMIHKNCAGTIPKPGPFSDADKTLLAAADNMLDTAREAFDRQAMSRGIEAIWAIVGDANRYFAGEAPWALKKTDPDRMGTVLYVTAEVVRQVAILAQPVMPESCARMLDQLSIAATDRNFSQLGEPGRIAPGSHIEKPVPVFPRYSAPEDDTAPTGGAS